MGPRAGRLAGTHQHIGLKNLTVPTLVIGSEKDRLLPMVSSRRIAKEVPNLAQFVELSGGHCAILERPDAVNKHLRWLIESASEQRRVSSGAVSSRSTSSAARWPDRMAPSRKPSTCRRFRFPPNGCRRRACATTARTSSTSRAAPLPSARPARIPLRPSSDRGSRSGSSAASPNSAAKPASARSRRSAGGQRVECPRVGEAQQDARAVIAGADVEGDEDRTFVGQRLTRAAVGAPERRLVGDIGLAQVALRPVLGELAVLGRQVGQERDARRGVRVESRR